jgi:hypothetical protein
MTFQTTAAPPNCPPILPLLKAGGALKFSRRTNRFFVVQHSREVAVNQTEAQRLASNGTLRPNGIDSHGNYVFALKAQSVLTPARKAPQHG